MVPPAVQLLPKKKRLRTKRNKPTGVAAVTGTKNELKGHEVKADSKPASSSSTTKPVSMLHATAVSKPPTSTSAPKFSNRPPTLPVGTASPIAAHKQSGDKAQRNFHLQSTGKAFPAQLATEATVLRYLTEPRLNSDSNIDSFFLRAEYSQYTYSPMRPIMEQFYEMRNLYGWKKRKDEAGREVWDEAGQDAWEGIRRAMVLDFNKYFGADVKSLDSWIKLCKVIGGIDPIPDTPEGCIEVIADTHVNIVDLLENVRIGEEVHKFESVEALSNYTIASGRYFPKDDAKAGGILQVLLRFILNPTKNRRTNRIENSWRRMGRGTRKMW